MESFELPVYGLIVLAGVVLGALVVDSQFDDAGPLRRGVTFSLLGFAAPAVFLGCKLAGAIDQPGEFWSDPYAFVLGGGNAASWGGLISGTIVAWTVLKRRGLPAWSYFDAAVPGVLVAYAIGRVGCHVTGDGCHGTPTASVFGCTYPTGLVPTLERVHPTSLYEAGYAVVLLVALAAIAPWARGTGAGVLFATYLVSHWAFRFAVEFLRVNPRHAGLSGAQWASLALVALGLVLLSSSSKRSSPSEARDAGHSEPSLRTR